MNGFLCFWYMLAIFNWLNSSPPRNSRQQKCGTSRIMLSPFARESSRIALFLNVEMAANRFAGAHHAQDINKNPVTMA